MLVDQWECQSMLEPPCCYYHYYGSYCSLSYCSVNLWRGWKLFKTNNPGFFFDLTFMHVRKKGRGVVTILGLLGLRK
ncbi:hypothetical protein IFM89_038471 [Coptis chinensis]|uniref:Uncharacterized protein n=1 Tax=Coptis chinensis TaxID=261450 RepID=A0A835H9N9_9MAGN|nr:hypothetical protein IFM89_038471 [Coptis chinensis]